MKFGKTIDSADNVVETTDRKFVTTAEKVAISNIKIIKFKQGTTNFTTAELAEGEIGFLYE